MAFNNGDKHGPMTKKHELGMIDRVRGALSTNNNRDKKRTGCKDIDQENGIASDGEGKNMKRNRKRGYFWYFRKHILILFLIWIVLCYAVLQALYFYLFSKIQQKSAANFYEGMEMIQYITKDASIKEVETEIMYTLGKMSVAGNYAQADYGMPTGHYTGTILRIRADALLPLLELGMSGYGYDGEGNLYLGGDGRGWGFILDEQSGEVICGTLGEKQQTLLFLIDEAKEKNQQQYKSRSVIDYGDGTDLLRCDSEKLNPVYEVLGKIRQEEWEKLLSKDPDARVGRRLIWKMDSFYRKDDEFFPGRVSLYYVSVKDDSWTEKEPDEIITEYVFDSPEEGYSLYVPDAERERMVALFIDMTPSEAEQRSISDQQTWKPDDAFRTEAIEGLKNVKARGGTQDLGKGWSVGNPLLYFLDGKMVFVRYAYFMDGTGHSYRACSYQTISGLFKGNWGNIYWWASFLGFWMVIFGSVTSYLEYHRKRYQFLTEEYRRILMDSMAHDLKSPLMAISGYAENLAEHVNDDKREHYVQEIQDSVKYMNSIVMKNLEVMKFDGQKHRLQIRETDMRKLFTEAFSRYQEQIGERKLQVKLEGGMTAKGDEELLRKVADNLAANAIFYTPEGGEIVVAFSDRVLMIKNVSGIEYQGKLGRLWEPFVRGEESRAGNGTGLGLAIVASILDRHGWKYSLKFEKETNTFICTIRIPLGIIRIGT